MAGLIVKSPYIKCGGGGGGAGGYARYIGTRERVELLPDDRPPTRRQEQLVRDLERDFPDTMAYPEHVAYAEQPTKARASEYVSAALDSHWENAQRSEVYAKYIATRPRAERLGSHGLFGDEDFVDLDATMKELEEYKGNVWTHILSLKRADAARLGYDNALAWRDTLRAHRNDIAAAMHIPPEDFRWCAAFHNEGDHPHVHMMAWSVKPGQAYLSKQGIREIKSTLTNQIFLHEMTQLYEQKSSARNELVKEARHALVELSRELKNKIADAPALEDQMQELAMTMSTVSGKHQYGYLKKPIKRQVDTIVDALEDFPTVRACYDRWLELQEQVDGYYKDEKRARLRLSEQKEFRAIKNAVIAAADQINAGALTFEDRELDERDEPEEFPYAPYDYHRLRDAILDRDVPHEERLECVEELTQLAVDGDQHAQYFLGKLYRDGGLLIPDDEQAEKWFLRASESGNDCAEYALGKLLQSEHRMEEAAHWYDRAAAQGNEYAEYRLAKLYLTGSGVPKDVGRAVELLEASAKANNPYAAYALGKLCLDGTPVQKDAALGMAYMEQAAQMGHAFAQFFLDRQDSLKPPSVMLAVTRLLHGLANILQTSVPCDATTRPIEIDRKSWQEMLDKRIALGHKADDHEEQSYTGMSMATPW
ncbi:MAG: sel1 repeat family protein [Ruminococcaceae bacterium]|nr:sel1 repeat family protein [Oscillospiraceae bacterium]